MQFGCFIKRKSIISFWTNLGQKHPWFTIYLPVSYPLSTFNMWSLIIYTMFSRTLLFYFKVSTLKLHSNFLLNGLKLFLSDFLKWISIFWDILTNGRINTRLELYFEHTHYLLLRTNLAGRLSALPPFDVKDGRRSTESEKDWKKAFIVLTSKEGIAMALDCRLSVELRQKEGRQGRK